MASREWTLGRMMTMIKPANNGCLEWTGTLWPSGYGRVGYKKRMLTASRLMMIFIHGEQPRDVFVCHHCDNPKCINPDHLFFGTAKDNAQDLAKKGKTWPQKKTHCKWGHEFTFENTLRLKRGSRQCRTCLKGYHERSKQKRASKE